MTTYRRETRAEWGAAAPKNRRTDVAPRGVAIHYPGPGDYPSARYVMAEHKHCQSLMRRWQEMHMARGSNDLEYGAVLCQHLVLMEARTEHDRPKVRVGSNGTAAANTTHTSVQLMRGTLDPPPTDEEIRALGEYVAWLREAGGWGPEVTGHRDHYATACPGDALYRRLPDIRRIADEGLDDMPLTDEDVTRIADAVWARIVGKDLSGTDRSAAWMLTGARNNAFQSAKGAPTQPEPEPEPELQPCDGYTVVKGDTLGKIATAHGISLADLLALNPQITDPNRIEVGDCIKVPTPKA